MLRKSQQSGDTIVEVLFAVAVFGLAVVSSLALVSTAIATSQRSLESTVVRQEMESQVELLKFMHNSYLSVNRQGDTYLASDRSPAANWYRLVEAIPKGGSASDFGVCDYGIRPGIARFYINPVTGSHVSNVDIQEPETWSKVTVDEDGANPQSQGLWVEAVRSVDSTSSNQSNIGYIDFHVRACWNSVGMSEPMTLGTIVRLYEPR